MKRGNPDALRRGAEKKRQETLEKAERGIQQLIKSRSPINFNTVAEAAGVSRAWLYAEPEIKERIEALRKQSTNKKEVPPKQKPSDASKDVLIRTLKGRIKRLEAENQELRRQNEVAYGQVLQVRELGKKVERLEAENQRFKDQVTEVQLATSSNIHAELEKLGVCLNSTLEKLINETPRGIVETAIDALSEAQSKGKVANPGGFLNKAIRDCWQPNQDIQCLDEMDEFNKWWQWAYKEGVAVASQQIDQNLYIYTAENEWISFKEATSRFRADLA